MAQLSPRTSRTSLRFGFYLFFGFVCFAITLLLSSAAKDTLLLRSALEKGQTLTLLLQSVSDDDSTK